MDLQILSRAGDAFALGSTVLPSFHRLPGADPISVVAGFGDILFQNIKGHGFDIWYSTYNITTPVTLIGRADIPVLELHIPFRNTIRNKWDGIGYTETKEKQFDLSFTPFVYNEASFDMKGDYHTFDIHYHKSTLQQFAPFFPLLADFLDKVERGEPASLLQQPRFLDLAMDRLLQEMLRYHFHDALAPLYYESKAMELLVLLAQSMSETRPAGNKFSDAALDDARAAKALVLADPGHHYTAAELARSVGTNIYTLKTAFKHLFGTSLFRFGENVRMELACQLLLDTSLNITEVAWQAGYPDVQNFSIAFKRLYGMSPGQFRARK